MFEAEESLLDEIDAVPDDPERRSIYADWLEERGDPRCEFVRAELEVDAKAAQGDGRGLQAAIDQLIQSGRTFDGVWKRRLIRHRLSEILIVVHAQPFRHFKRRRKRSTKRCR